jgi:hypothetical protein
MRPLAAAPGARQHITGVFKVDAIDLRGADIRLSKTL